MKEVGCTLKLAEDTGWTTANRVVDLTINSGVRKRSGTWRMNSNASDPRIRVASGSGRWTVTDTSGVWTMYLLAPEDLEILVELYDVTGDPLGNVTCGSDLGGTGWHQGPPSTDLRYRLAFPCI